MAFNNNNFNNNTIFKPSTDGCALFSGDRMLRVSYYDTLLKIEIRYRNAEGKFPKPANFESEISIILSATQAASVVGYFEKLTEKLIEFRENPQPGKKWSFAVPVTNAATGVTKALEFSTGDLGTDGTYSPEVTLHMATNEEGKHSASHVFKTTNSKVLINYDGGNGNIEVIDEFPQLVILMNIFHTFIESYGKAAVHFAKSPSGASLSRISSAIDRIAYQVGVPVKQDNYAGNNNGGYQRNQSTNLSNVSIQPQNASLSEIMDFPY